MSVRYYAGLLANRSRIEAFEAGIRSAVRPGDRVLDLGTGVGTYAFFAARAGAAEVVAVDKAPVLHLAALIARAQGLADRITFLRGSVPEIEIPGTFDVIVFEDFPVPFFSPEIWRLLQGVSSELLRKGGRMVPEAVRLNVAPVQSEKLRGSLRPLGTDCQRFGIDWSVLNEYLANEPTRANLKPEALLSPPLRSKIVPMMPLPGPGDLELVGSWVATTPGTIDALAFWFDLYLGEGGWISNEPRDTGAEPWGQWILPLGSALGVGPGNKVSCRVVFEALSDGAPGWCAWEVRVGNEVSRGHQFGGTVADPEALEPDAYHPDY